MSHVFSSLVATLLGGGLLGLAACSDMKVETPAETVEDIGLAPMPDRHARLIVLVARAKEARETGDGEALLMAANDLRQLGARPASGGLDLSREWEREAYAMDADLDIPPMRGRVRGPAYRQEAIAPGEILVIEDVFYAAERAEMTLSPGTAETRLAWNVLAPDGDGPVCASEINGETSSCSFLPVFTETYRITIENESQQAASFLFITN